MPMKIFLRNDNEHSIMTDPVTGTPAVAEIVMDFERAAWRAADHVMPDIRCQGCAFHWGQAVWRKAQELGLRRAYLEDNATFMHDVIEKVIKNTKCKFSPIPFKNKTPVPQLEFGVSIPVTV